MATWAVQASAVFGNDWSHFTFRFPGAHAVSKHRQKNKVQTLAGVVHIPAIPDTGETQAGTLLARTT